MLQYIAFGFTGIVGSSFFYGIRKYLSKNKNKKNVGLQDTYLDYYNAPRYKRVPSDADEDMYEYNGEEEV